DVVELVVVRHLLARGGQPPGDDLVAVLAAGAHALLQRLARRRQDEYADRARHLRPHLARALPVDLQEHVVAGGEQRPDRLARRALPVAVHAGVFEEIARLDHALELAGADEVVVLGVALARPWRARGERDRQADALVTCEAGVDDARLSGTRWRRHDVQGTPHLAHSMFWTCSRTWSISTLSSIAAAEVRASTDFDPSVLASRLNSCNRKSRRRPTGSRWPSTLRISAMWLSRRSSSSSTSSFCSHSTSSCSMRPGSTGCGRSASRASSFCRCP